MQSPKTNIGSRMAFLKSSVTFNVAPSWDANFSTSQFVKFLPCKSCPRQLQVLLLWKRLRVTKAQPRSGRPHKLTERDRRVLKRVQIVCPPLQHSLPSSKLPLEATPAQELFVGSFMKWGSMAQQSHTSLRSPCSMPSVHWSGEKLAIGLWSSVNILWSDDASPSGRFVRRTASPSDGPTDKSEFGRCQENSTCPNA